jgi:hypothetical protein
MGKRVNKTTYFSVTVDLSHVDGFNSGELVLRFAMKHPKVLPATLGSYEKRVRVDLTKVLNETIAN